MALNNSIIIQFGRDIGKSNLFITVTLLTAYKHKYSISGTAGSIYPSSSDWNVVYSNKTLTSFQMSRDDNDKQIDWITVGY